MLMEEVTEQLRGDDLVLMGGALRLKARLEIGDTVEARAGGARGPWQRAHVLGLSLIVMLGVEDSIATNLRMESTHTHTRTHAHTHTHTHTPW